MDRHRGARQVLKVFGVVLVTDHVRGLTALQCRADSISADGFLRVAAAR